MTKIKNWRTFQHYKHRNPPWIRFHRTLLDDLDWHKLEGEAAKSLVMLWLIASEDEGNLPPSEELAFRLRISEKQLNTTLSKLSHWLEQDASTPLAECVQHAVPETETEAEAETEADSSETETERLRANARDEIVSHETSPPAPVEGPKGQSGKYAFESGIIKLTQYNFDKWRAAFSNLDLSAELIAMTEWAGEQGPEKWFHAVAGLLAKRNREQKIKIEQAKVAGRFKWSDGTHHAKPESYIP